MTERLSQLLHGEAAELPVPPPPSDEILAEGRRRRHRARAGTIGLGLAANVAVAVGGWTVLPDGRGNVDLAAVASYQTWGAVAIGQRVVIGDTEIRWDGDITSMYYTSRGVAVRSGGDYSLIRADGEVSSISVDITDRVAGFEPDSTRFAYAEPAGPQRWEVVVHDAATDAELARVEVEGRAYGSWTAPPVAIDGDRVWIHLAGRWAEVDWRTGSVGDVPGTDTTYELANRVYAVQRDPRDEGPLRPWEIRSWADGSLVGSADLPRDWYALFSPDGRYLRAFSQDFDTRDAPDRIYDAVTGESRTLPPGDTGWTPEGDLLVVSGDEISVCPPLGGECRSRSFDGGDGDLRIAGNPYES